MTKEKGKPQIRFSGFKDTWEQRKVTELGEIYIGLVTTMTSHYTDQGALLIRNSDIKDGCFEFGDNPIYLDDDFAKQNASRKHRVGDVITVHTGDIGTSAVISEKEAGSIGFATIVTRPNKDIITSDYLCIYLNTDTHKNFAMNISTGDGRNNYNLKDYYECVVPVPSLDEQNKISDFIKNINHLITLYQCKVDKLTAVKKSMLEKMFPKNGRDVPEIRFKGFIEPWEQRKLGEITDSYSGGTPTAGKKEYYEGDIPFIRSGEISSDKTELFITEEGLNISSAKLIMEGDILYALYGATSGEVSISKLNGAINQAILAIQPHKNYDSQFIMQWLRKSKGNIISTYLQGGQGNLSGNIVKELLVDTPSYDEQIRIGGYFSNLDNLITLYQRKLEKLQNIKKSMLERMFI